MQTGLVPRPIVSFPCTGWCRIHSGLFFLFTPRTRLLKRLLRASKSGILAGLNATPRSVASHCSRPKHDDSCVCELTW